jgi:hypothetical protein
MRAEPGERSRISEYTTDWVTEEVCFDFQQERKITYSVHQNNQTGCRAQQPPYAMRLEIFCPLPRGKAAFDFQLVPSCWL